MARVVQFPLKSPTKLGHKKVGKRKKPNLEDYGQLNLFSQSHDDTPVVSLNKTSFFERALMLDEQGDEGAEKYYELAVEHEESVEDALCNLGIIKSGQKDFSKAIDYLTRCLKVNPRHFEAHYNLGNVYSDIGNLALAKIHYELSTAIEPTYPNGFYNLGLVLISMENYEEAIDRLHTYMKLMPDSGHDIAQELIKTLNAIAK